MPRIVDYPRASLPKTLDAARAVAALGGSCSEEMCAKRLGRKTGGAFNALISAAAKYGLLEKRKGNLSTTDVFREHELAYTEADRIQALRRAFLGVPLFARLYDRFAENRVPEDILDKLLIREFDVPDALASRVGQYFLEGAKMVELLTDEGRLVRPEAGADTNGTDLEDVAEDADENSGEQDSGETDEPDHESRRSFVVKISGPGIDSAIRVAGNEDFVIVEAMLSKIRKSLEEQDT